MHVRMYGFEPFLGTSDHSSYGLYKSKGTTSVKNAGECSHGNDPECNMTTENGEEYPCGSLLLEKRGICLHKDSSAENTVAQAVAKGITDGVSGTFAVVAAKDNQQCFYCGELGHFLKDWPEKDSVTDRRYRNLWHQQQSSRQPRPGNFQWSPEQPHATTSNQKPSCSALAAIWQQLRESTTTLISLRNSSPDSADLPYRAIQVGTQRQLVGALTIHFVDECVFRIPTEKYRPPDGPRNIVIIEDTVSGPDNFNVFPDVQTVGLDDEILVSLYYIDTPFQLYQ
ncbi:hypothetical protein TURU_008864 [Turdus rufiventris]|nr:hypothetical protein TURU_008864 [Turdus rufiventris]